MKGFIILHRKLLSWEWYNHINTKVLFIHCLLRANHTTANWRGQSIKRGEFITSIKNLSEETGLSPKQVRICLDNLILTKELGKRTTNLNTTISVLNFDYYQTNGKPNGKRRANGGQTEGKQRATDNNDNNANNETMKEQKRKEILMPFESNDFLNMWNLWKQFKKQQFNFTYKSAISEQAALTDLNTKANGQELSAIEIIKQSMAAGYKGLFELKENNNGKAKQNIAQYANKYLSENDPDYKNY